MKLSLITLSALVAFSIIVPPVMAQSQDKAGAKDHPALKRYQDSFIFEYSEQSFAEYLLPLGKALNPSVPASEGRTIEKEETIEGRVTRLSYLAPAGRSSLEVFRNYEQELSVKGFSTLSREEKRSLVSGSGRATPGSIPRSSNTMRPTTASSPRALPGPKAMSLSPSMSRPTRWV